VDQVLHGREVNGPFCVIEFHCLRKMQWLRIRVWAHGQKVAWLVVLSLCLECFTGWQDWEFDSR
jgi:hypothetical protein